MEQDREQYTKQHKGRGFQRLSPEERRKIAAKGGRSQGKQNNKGNFANRPKEDREAAGRLGGRS